MIFKFGFWNQLADGLGLGEFLTTEGDQSIVWKNRKNDVLSVLSALLAECDAVVLAECDHPLWLLEQLRKNRDDIRAVCYFEVPIHEGKPSINKPSVCRRLHQKRESRHNGTFEQEFSTLGEWTPAKFSALYNLLASGRRIYNQLDSFISDDSLTLFYHSRLHLKRVNATLFQPFGDKDSFRCDFECNSIPFSIYGAHLASGEEYARESLHEILKDVSNVGNVVVLMDSNNSPQFEREYGDKLVLSQVVQQMGFQNLIEPQYNECFKMRHCQGGQAAKFGQLMFDCLEKVIVSDTTKGQQLYPYSELAFNYQHYSQDCHEILFAIREDPIKRQAFFKHAANINNIAGASDYSPALVTSSKGESLFTMDGMAKNRWGPQVPTADKLRQLAAELATDEHKLYQILSQLYPNGYSPSDHPPVAVQVEFY